jgi:hypothetical protein
MQKVVYEYQAKKSDYANQADVDSELVVGSYTEHNN